MTAAVLIPNAPLEPIDPFPTPADVRRPSFEGLMQMAIMLMIGGAAGAGSFTHVHDVAASHGQAGWLAWADAVVLELMSIASGLELRRRKRVHAPLAFPASVLAVAVVLSLGAQVVEAEPSPIGWIAAAIPAMGFLVMVKIALSHSGNVAGTAGPAPAVPTSPGQAADVVTGLSPARSLPTDPVVTKLIPVARTAAEALGAQGRRVTRAALAEALRAEGYGVSNARASELLHALRPDLGVVVSQART